MRVVWCKACHSGKSDPATVSSYFLLFDNEHCNCFTHDIAGDGIFFSRFGQRDVIIPSISL